jgi:hypothetical protein
MDEQCELDAPSTKPKVPSGYSVESPTNIHTSCRIASLPAHIVSCILSYIPTKDRKNMALTEKRLRDIVIFDQHWTLKTGVRNIRGIRRRHVVCLDYLRTPDIPALVGNGLLCRSLVEITWDYSSISSASMCDIFKATPNVTTLTVFLGDPDCDKIHANDFGLVYRQATQLQRISFMNIRVSDKLIGGIFNEALLGLTQLRELSYTSVTESPCHCRCHSQLPLPEKYLCFLPPSVTKLVINIHFDWNSNWDWSRLPNLSHCSIITSDITSVNLMRPVDDLLVILPRQFPPYYDLSIKIRQLLCPTFNFPVRRTLRVSCGEFSLTIAGTRSLQDYSFRATHCNMADDGREQMPMDAHHLVHVYMMIMKFVAAHQRTLESLTIWSNFVSLNDLNENVRQLPRLTYLAVNGLVLNRQKTSVLMRKIANKCPNLG